VSKRRAPSKKLKPTPRKKTGITAKKPKAGRSASASAARIAAFVESYLTNGHNATAAAAAAGCTGRQLGNAGWKMLQKPEVQRLLAARAQQVAELAGMNTENWAAELRAVAFSRVGDLFGPADMLMSPVLLPGHVQASVSKVKFSPEGRVIEYRFWDKTAALQIMARHLGLFERDNAQQSDIKVLVELVG
jgi:hypothetical protein